jgi:hypothetical protein
VAPWPRSMPVTQRLRSQKSPPRRPLLEYRRPSGDDQAVCGQSVQDSAQPSGESSEWDSKYLVPAPHEKRLSNWGTSALASVLARTAGPGLDATAPDVPLRYHASEPNWGIPTDGPPSVVAILKETLIFAVSNRGPAGSSGMRSPTAKRMPVKSTGSRQRLRACSPAANHSLHSDHSLGHCQFTFVTLGSPIICVLPNAL